LVCGGRKQAHPSRRCEEAASARIAPDASLLSKHGQEARGAPGAPQHPQAPRHVLGPVGARDRRALRRSPHLGPPPQGQGSCGRSLEVGASCAEERFLTKRPRSPPRSVFLSSHLGLSMCDRYQHPELADPITYDLVAFFPLRVVEQREGQKNRTMCPRHLQPS
jgi:hypothetical protein